MDDKEFCGSRGEVRTVGPANRGKLGNVLESGELWPCCTIETYDLPYISDQYQRGLFSIFMKIQ